jgi:ribosomal protein S18 acetylase RimI-like enzyme
VARVQIRPVRHAEHAAAGTLVVRAYQQLDRDQGDYVDELRDVASRVETAEVLVALLDGQLAGAVTYVPGPGPLAEWDDPDAAGIRMLAVDPAFQGRGVGRALVNACLARARTERRPRLILHTTDTMQSAQRLYARLGFQRRPDLDWEPVPGVTLRGYVFEF